jgi:hypothetical protein
LWFHFVQFRTTSFGMIHNNIGWVFHTVFADKVRKFLYLCLSFIASERRHLTCRQNKTINTKGGTYYVKELIS